MKKLLGGKRSGRLDCPKTEVEEKLWDTHGDLRREEELKECAGNIEPAAPTVAFDTGELK